MRLALLGTAGALWMLCAPTICIGSPSFNDDRPKLAKLSDMAGSELHEALSNVHLMVEFLMQNNPEQAQESRMQADAELVRALVSYRRIAELAPKQPLIIEPRSGFDKRSIAALRQILKDRNIPFPKTEQELALLAVQMVSDFKSALDAGERLGPKSKYELEYFAKLFREEGEVLDASVFCTVIWNLQNAPRSEGSTEMHFDFRSQKEGAPGLSTGPLFRHVSSLLSVNRL